jgi:predicted Rossmann-fold nucleotide-binding protein
MSPPTHRLCVYCGSSPGHNPDYVQAARDLGQAMALADVGLVYGGGSLGLTSAWSMAVAVWV